MRLSAKQCGLLFVCSLIQGALASAQNESRGRSRADEKADPLKARYLCSSGVTCESVRVTADRLSKAIISCNGIPVSEPCSKSGDTTTEAHCGEVSARTWVEGFYETYSNAENSKANDSEGSSASQQARGNFAMGGASV